MREAWPKTNLGYGRRPDRVRADVLGVVTIVYPSAQPHAERFLAKCALRRYSTQEDDALIGLATTIGPYVMGRFLPQLIERHLKHYQEGCPTWSSVSATRSARTPTTPGPAPSKSLPGLCKDRCGRRSIPLRTGLPSGDLECKRRTSTRLRSPQSSGWAGNSIRMRKRPLRHGFLPIGQLRSARIGPFPRPWRICRPMPKSTASGFCRREGATTQDCMHPWWLRRSAGLLAAPPARRTHSNRWSPWNQPGLKRFNQSVSTGQAPQAPNLIGASTLQCGRLAAA